MEAFCCLALSLFLTNPAPLEMPQANGYRVNDGGRVYLEDRFDKFDLWTSESVDGRWIDDEGRVFILAHLDVLPPEGEAADETATRADFAAGRMKIKKRDMNGVRAAVAALSPVEIPERESRPRQMIRGMKDVDYWQGTNESVIVCAYLRDKEEVWRLAIWQLADGDDFDEKLKTFEKRFLSLEAASLPVWSAKSASAVRSERELLRDDARHSVSAYDNWHVTDANEFSILDDLPRRSGLVAALTNDLPVMRRLYAATLPTSVDTTNVLCVARIFADRGEYQDALETAGLTNMIWSGAYWCPSRRELVAYDDGRGTVPVGDWGSVPIGAEKVASLIQTIRHEAFHQYLSYATTLISTSPWLNEGYAQYFEAGTVPETKGTDPRKGRGTDPGSAWGTDPARVHKRGTVPSKWGEIPHEAEDIERYSLYLPSVLVMDYDQFYAGTDEIRRLNYILAWSLAVFIEEGAPDVRFQPFKNVKRDYFKSLLETKDMRQATLSVFGNPEFRAEFIGEWVNYWKSHQ